MSLLLSFNHTILTILHGFFTTVLINKNNNRKVVGKK